MKKLLLSTLIILCAIGAINFTEVKAANTEDTDFLYYVDSENSPTISKRKKQILVLSS